MLKLQYFGHLMRRADSLKETLLLGKTEGRRRRGQQRMRWLDGIANLMGMSVSKFWKVVKDREPRRDAVHRAAKSRTRLSLSNWAGSTRCPSAAEHTSTHTVKGLQWWEQLSHNWGTNREEFPRRMKRWKNTDTKYSRLTKIGKTNL